MENLNDFINSGNESCLHSFVEYITKSYTQAQLQALCINIVNHLIVNKVNLTNIKEILEEMGEYATEELYQHLFTLSQNAEDKEHRFYAFSIFTSFYTNKDLLIEKLGDKIIAIRKHALQELIANNFINADTESHLISALNTLNSTKEKISFIIELVNLDLPNMSIYKENLLFNQLTIDELYSIINDEETYLKFVDLTSLYIICHEYKNLNNFDFLNNFEKIVLSTTNDETQKELFDIEFNELLEFLVCKFQEETPTETENSIFRLVTMQKCCELANILKLLTRKQVTVEIYSESVHVIFLINSIIVEQEEQQTITKTIVEYFKQLKENSNDFMLFYLLQTYNVDLKEDFQQYYLNNYKNLFTINSHEFFIENVSNTQYVQLLQIASEQIDLVFSQPAQEIVTELLNSNNIQDLKFVVHLLELSVALLSEEFMQVNNNVDNIIASDVNNRLLQLRSKLAEIISGLFSAFYNNEIIEQVGGRNNYLLNNCIIELFIIVLHGLNIVLTNPGIKDYNLENIETWCEQMINEANHCSRSNSFLSELFKLETFDDKYEKTKENANEIEQEQELINEIVILYHSTIADFLHLLQEFKYNTEELLYKYLQILFKMLFNNKSLQNDKQEIEYLNETITNNFILITQKLLNLENNSPMYMTLTLEIGLIYSTLVNEEFCLLEEIFNNIIITYVSNQTIIEQLMVSICCGCQLFKFREEDDENFDEELVSEIEDKFAELVCDDNKQECMQYAVFTEFLSLFICNSQIKYEIVNEFVKEIVNSMNLVDVGTYLVVKCGFDTNEIVNGEAINKEKIGEYNGFVNICEKLINEVI